MSKDTTAVAVTSTVIAKAVTRDAIAVTAEEQALIDVMGEQQGAGVGLIAADEVRPPSLRICQSGSPQRKKSQGAVFIEGLQEGQLFNSLTRQIYDTPLRFMVITSLGHTHVEFDPDKMGTVLAVNIPDGDPRTEFTQDGDGKSVKPRATKYLNYLVWLVDYQEMVALSFKSTQLKKAIQMNSLMKYPLKIAGRIIQKPAAWARMFEMTTIAESKDQQEWFGFVIEQVGISPVEEQKFVAGLEKNYGSKSVVIDYETDIDQTVDGPQPGDIDGEVVDDSMYSNQE